MDKLTIWIAYEKDYAEYRYILTKLDETINIFDIPLIIWIEILYTSFFDNLMYIVVII